MGYYVFDASLVLGLFGALILIITQLIPQTGFSYRPFHHKPVPGMCAYGQLSFPWVAAAYTIGYTFLWAGLLAVCIRSDREVVNQNKQLIAWMVITWFLYIGGHALIHYRVVVQHQTHERYNDVKLTWEQWQRKGHAARAYITKRALPGGIMVIMAITIMAVYGTAVHTDHLQELPAIGYMCYLIGWGLLMRVRLRHAHSPGVEIAAFAWAVIFWVLGLGLIVWAMATGSKTEDNT